jgi:hypothetical protein
VVGKSWLIVIFLFSFATLAFGQALKQDALVVSVNGENQAALIDPTTYEVVARLPSGINPHDIAVSPDGRYAYIAVMGTPQEPGHSVTVLDIMRRVVKTTIELNPYNRCHDLRVSHNGARFTNLKGFAGVPVYSPDEKMIAFQWRETNNSHAYLT